MTTCLACRFQPSVRRRLPASPSLLISQQRLASPARNSHAVRASRDPRRTTGPFATSATTGQRARPTYPARVLLPKLPQDAERDARNRRTNSKHGAAVCASVFTRWLGVTVTHRITLSARNSTDSGSVMPRALAVLKLTTSSKLVGCSIGRSPGLAPLKILSTYPAALRNWSA